MMEGAKGGSLTKNGGHGESQGTENSGPKIETLFAKNIRKSLFFGQILSIFHLFQRVNDRSAVNKFTMVAQSAAANKKSVRSLFLQFAFRVSFSISIFIV
jgi:hypothetical protein